MNSSALSCETHFLVRRCVDRLAGDGRHTIADEIKEVRIQGLHRVQVRNKGSARESVELCDWRGLAAGSRSRRRCGNVETRVLCGFPSSEGGWNRCGRGSIIPPSEVGEEPPSPRLRSVISTARPTFYRPFVENVLFGRPTQRCLSESRVECTVLQILAQSRNQKGDVSEAILEIRYRRIQVLPSRGKQKQYHPLRLTVIHAEERGKPQGREKIHWKLMTDLPVASRQDALEMIQWYALRWKLETFHKILKSGCQAEDAKLRTAERLVNLIAVLCILGWRIFWMTMINRSVQAATPKLAFTGLELRLLDQLVKD
jgi:hypothetical protein